MTQLLSFPIGSLVELNSQGEAEHPSLARFNPTGLFLITECSADTGGLTYGLDNKYWWFRTEELTLIAEPCEESLKQVFALMDAEDSSIPEDEDDEMEQPGGPVGDDESFDDEEQS